ncbi:MAG: hypothetical protein JXA03_15465 [Bacteroidales bacterium]|nr:hypothetical protein [Bacteroidales bacterium]
MKITLRFPKKNIAAVPGGGGSPNEAFPVGSVFTTVVNTNPGTLLGYGSWEQFGAGKVLAGYDETDPAFDEALKEGGAKTVAAQGSNSQPVFTGEAMGTHQHSAVSAGTPAGALSTATGIPVSAGRELTQAASPTHGHQFTGSAMATHQHSAESAGTPTGSVSAPAFTGSATSVVQPYVVVYFWKRTE